VAALRLAELHGGVWMRPANLRREWPAFLTGRTWRFEARAVGADGDAGELAARLWDLAGWAKRAEALLYAWGAADRPPRGFALAAVMVRQLQADPRLSRALLLARWP
jgi:phenylacetic acid degradation operon negative regulatory protein